jgi:hypothetical protein
MKNGYFNSGIRFAPLNVLGAQVYRVLDGAREAGRKMLLTASYADIPAYA